MSKLETCGITIAVMGFFLINCIVLYYKDDCRHKDKKITINEINELDENLTNNLKDAYELVIELNNARIEYLEYKMNKIKNHYHKFGNKEIQYR